MALFSTTSWQGVELFGRSHDFHDVEYHERAQEPQVGLFLPRRAMLGHKPHGVLPSDLA